MNIGFVSAWFERGAAYVTKAYIEALESEHNIFVYARGGEKYEKKNPPWINYHVTYGYNLSGTQIHWPHLRKWIIKNNIETVFFNEQHDFEIAAKLKYNIPNIKIGSYIDYYKEDTVDLFNIYDFLICNTKRHYSVFKSHPQCFYIPWGTNIDIFRPNTDQIDNKSEIVFFHSAGMSDRKGTDLLLEAFIDKKIYQKAKLIVHTQKNISLICKYDMHTLKKYNIDIIEKTVSAPGLYCLGDVYVYPTKLEGVGLTIYEALSCGLPVIITDEAPMNEIVDASNGYLLEVEKRYCRKDAYYWPLSIVSIESIAEGMNYYINNTDQLPVFKKETRKFSIKNINWHDRFSIIQQVFQQSELLTINKKLIISIIKFQKKREIRNFILAAINLFVPKIIRGYIFLLLNKTTNS